MITRPLDLNSKLRPPPRSFDWVFFVNIALIVMFFLFFGSRFILSPALVVGDGGFHAPVQPEERISYVPGTVVVSIKANGQIFTDTGLVSFSQLRVWLEEKIKTSPDASLLLRADEAVTIQEISRISALARGVGFKSVAIPVVPGKLDAAEQSSAMPAR